MEEAMHDYTFEEALRARVEAVAKACEAIAEWLKPVAKAIQKVFKAFDRLFYKWYLAEGAKYGKTRKGRDRWFEELVAESRKRQEIENAQFLVWQQEEMRAAGFALGRRIARANLN